MRPTIGMCTCGVPFTKHVHGTPCYPLPQATRKVEVLNRLPRLGETVQFWVAAPNITGTNGKILPEGQYLVTLEGPECNCEETGIGRPKWSPSCPLHHRTTIPRKPQEDDSLAQESVSIGVGEGVLDDLSYLLMAEDARLVEAYLVGVARGQTWVEADMNDAEAPG